MLLSALRQEDMLRHKARADSLLETAAAVHTDDPVHAKAARVMKAVQLGCECERCSIVLLDEVQEHLFLVSTDRDAAGITIPCGQGIAGAVVASGEVENVADAYADDRFDKTTDEKTGFVTRNILAVPLRNEGRVVGVLMALNQAITFDSEHQETLEAIADQISASMLADLLNHMFTGSAEDHSRNDEELTRARLALLSEYAQFQTIKRESSKGGRTIMLASEILTGREKLTRSSSGKWLTTASKVSLNSLSLSTFSSSLPAGLTADDLDSWSFDPDRFNVAEQLQIASVLIQRSGVLSSIEVPPDKLTNFMQAVSGGYHDNPYHNFTHGFHVMHGCYLLMTQGVDELSGRVGALSHLEMLVLMLSAIGHDIGHGGMNNAFMVNSSSALALRYNDVSVLENHHAATLAALLSESDTAVLDGLNLEQRRSARKLMIKSILATDMATHAGER